MEYEFFEDSDMEDESEEGASHVKEEARSAGNESRASTITLSSDGELEEEMNGEESDDDAFDAALIYEKEASEHEHLKQDVKIAAKAWPELERELCFPSVQIEAPVSGNEGTCSVVLTLNVSTLPDLCRRLWELGTAVTVSVILDGIHKEKFRSCEQRPVVLARIDSDKPSKFPVGECLSNVVKPLVTHTYSLPENISPNEAGSFFLMLYEQLVERLRTLTEFCMVCGSKLYAGGLLPSICAGELCQYQYQELGLLDGLTTPRVSAPVLSLLLMAFNAAVSSPRWKDILTPAPSARDRDRLLKEAKQLYKKVDKKWGFVESGLDVHSVLACAMPCAKEILNSPSTYQNFKKATPSVAEFLEWLVISNQSYLELVPQKYNVDYLKTPHQFVFVADTPQKQAEFDELVKSNGRKTRYLFHGSRMENWHSIIRSGLRNMSGTKYQLVGAAHGAGIYLSNHLATSYHYCTRFDVGNVSENCVNNKCCMSSVTEGGMTLLAVVEVVDTPQTYRYNKDNIVVVLEEKWCSIRMLVTYSGKNVPNIDLNNMNSESRKQIKDVAHMYKTADLEERAKHF
ncbi:hypothetical protein PMAYCL1PPCAC_29786 [Pristionchus mayeri]|uniref:Poly [ADP-ribose] polymerase n=1 Tax=Pristionchus mayeri TaxID=1317129 RepID=A0AAN5DAS8_9BILA|nr:hypothetical protein PMAYCL1PPCAC_29786 [Pristionchus mayeri]